MVCRHHHAPLQRLHLAVSARGGGVVAARLLVPDCRGWTFSNDSRYNARPSVGCSPAQPICPSGTMLLKCAQRPKENL